MQYGVAIRKARALRSVSQAQLAKMTGLASSYVSFIETGRRIPSTKALEAIAGALDIPLYLLVLMASDKKELRGIDKTSGDGLAQGLLKVILAAEDKGNT
jgi:transcriptional regulator with XRE-family HTH domain